MEVLNNSQRKKQKVLTKYIICKKNSFSSLPSLTFNFYVLMPDVSMMTINSPTYIINNQHQHQPKKNQHYDHHHHKQQHQHHHQHHSLYSFATAKWLSRTSNIDYNGLSSTILCTLINSLNATLFPFVEEENISCIAKQSKLRTIF